MRVHPGYTHNLALIRRSILFFSILSLLTLLAACGGSTTTSSNSSTTSSSGSKASTCDKSTGLTLYSAQGYDSDAAKAFQQQSGITTKLVDDSTGNILAK